jgi:hypothetical protein
MKRQLFSGAVLIAALTALTLGGCAGAFSMGPTQPSALAVGPGWIMTDVKAGSFVVGDGSKGTKKGTACGTEILGMVAQGDNSITTAMANGGITKLHFVEYSYKSYVFNVYAEFCTIASGT